MMECDNCRERPAEVHLTAIESDQMRTLHLCTACAAEKGLSASTQAAPLVDFLAQLGKGEAESTAAARSEPCPYCGTTAAVFRRTGRVGCAQCYAHFEVQLRGLLRRLHGSAQHVGKLYVSESTEISDLVSQLASMKRRLQRAIETEDFETAAELRDRIHELEEVE